MDDCEDCGHPFTDHSASLDCRICKAAGAYFRCGYDCSGTIRQMLRDRRGVKR